MDTRVDVEVLAVTTADVETDSARRLGQEERGDEGPGLVTRGGEVRRDGLVDGVDVGGLVGVWRFRGRAGLVCL